jgi:hypothetical protein
MPVLTRIRTGCARSRRAATFPRLPISILATSVLTLQFLDSKFLSEGPHQGFIGGMVNAYLLMGQVNCQLRRVNGQLAAGKLGGGGDLLFGCFDNLAGIFGGSGTDSGFLCCRVTLRALLHLTDFRTQTG